MTNEDLDLPVSNPYRTEKSVRQLSATDLGVSVPNTQGNSETNRWDELREATDKVSTDGVKAAIAAEDSTVVTSIDIQRGESQRIHAIELGIWKAYSESQSPITHILVQAPDDEYTTCGRCLQTVLDYSSDALVRIVHSSEDKYDEYSVDQESILGVGDGSTKKEDDEQQDIGTDTDIADRDGKDSMSIPETPPFSDVDVEEDAEIEFVRMNAPVYHLKYQTHDETFCGTDLTGRESVSGATKPALLEPCKPCHGKTSLETVEEQRIRLRAQLSERVDTISATEDDATTFSEDEIDAILAELPVKTPTNGGNAVEFRDRLSRVIVDVHNDRKNPLTFSREEMEALLAALDGEGTIPEEAQLLTHTTAGRVARIPLSELTLQHRAGKGELGISLAEGESPTATLAISPREQMYVFTNLGQIYQMEAHQVPTVDRGGEPTLLSDLIDLDEDETLQAAFTCSDFEDREYVILGSSEGYIKRTATEDFENIRRTGIRAIELESDDDLREACLMSGERDLLMTTRKGRAIRFKGNDVRPMGRTARGVKGIELDDGDEVVAVNVVDEESDIFTVTANGYGKRTTISKYRTQTRNGRGLVDISTGDRNGPVVAVETTSSEEEFVTMSKDGRTIRAAVDEVSILSRNTKGIQIMGLEPDDLVSNLAVFDA